MPQSMDQFHLVMVLVLLMCCDSITIVMCIEDDVRVYQDQHQQLSPRQVNTKYGALRGTIVTFSSLSSSISLPSIESYLGVPYATPPIGSLRFMPPVTPTHWRGVRLANKLSPVCPQRLPSSLDNTTESLKRMSSARLDYLRKILPMLKNQTEDCLYLNIWTPMVGSTQSPQTPKPKVPVIVFLHGESYDWNSGNAYDGSVLSSYGQVVVVTLNYRLGVFVKPVYIEHGFLPAVVDGSVRGNYGLMDQVAALHWIQENIGEFGGHQDNVTLMGYGHGAACAHLLMISPMAKGLFKRVVLMSGSALSPWAIARDADLYTKNLAQELRCPTHDSGAIVDCLRKKKFEDILNVPIKTPDHLSSFGPIIDSIVVPSKPSQHKSDIRLNNNNNKSNHNYNKGGSSLSFTPWQYDLMFGINRQESPCIFASEEELKGIDVGRRDRVLRTLVRNLFDFHQQAIFLTLINEYTDWTRPAEHPMAMLESLQDILSDALVVAPVIQTADHHSHAHHDPSGAGPTTQRPPNETHRGRTFFYVFVHQSEELIPGHQYQYHYLYPRVGCTHSEELSYLFGVPLASGHFKKFQSMSHLMSANGNYSKQEVSLAEAVMTYWINFAKLGDPNVWPNDLTSSSAHSSSPLSLNTNSRGRYDTVVWPMYDSIQRKYLMIGIKPKVRDHYHAHRLSFWLNLIPRLHHPGDEQVYLRHHLLSDHDNLATYDGVVRQLSFKFLAPLPTVKTFISDIKNKNQQDADDASSTTQTLHINTELNTVSSVLSVGDNPTAFPARTLNNSSSSVVSDVNYSAALTVTITIGVSLLILNLLIFAGVYYQLDKNNKRSANSGSASGSDQSQGDRGHRSIHETSPSPTEGLMMDSITPLKENPHTLIRPSPSPINANESIYYQYKQKSSAYQCNSNSIPSANTNSLRRVYKVPVPTVPDGHGIYYQQQSMNKVSIGLRDDRQDVPFTGEGLTTIGTSSIQHNCVAKEMAV